MFKEIADIQTADMLKLPVPEAEYHNVVLQPSEQQEKIVASLSERAEKVRNKQVDSNEDNMLVITNDGRTNPIPLGSYRGFQMTLCFDSFEKLFKISLQGALTYKVSLGTDVFGNIQRIDNLLESMPTQQIEYKEKLKNLEIQVENAKQEIAMPFPREEELKEKAARLDQLNILLNMDKRENEIVDGIQDEGEIQPQRESRDWER